MKKRETVAQVALRLVDDPATRSLVEVRKAVATRREELARKPAEKQRRYRERERLRVTSETGTDIAS